MIIVEYTIDPPILHEPLNAISDIEVTWEQTYGGDDVRQMLAWVLTDDFEAFEVATERDQGVTNVEMLAEPDDRRLYRFDFTEVGRRTDVYPVIVRSGGVIQEAVGTNEGWRIQVQFPDRGALEEFFQFCREHDIEFTFHQLYDQTGLTSQGKPALTTSQREILLEAVDSGYLSIPRECSLAELGTRLDISESAASERFRRAVQNLIEANVTR